MSESQARRRGRAPSAASARHTSVGGAPTGPSRCAAHSCPAAASAHTPCSSASSAAWRSVGRRGMNLTGGIDNCHHAPPTAGWLRRPPWLNRLLCCLQRRARPWSGAHQQCPTSISILQAQCRAACSAANSPVGQQVEQCTSCDRMLICARAAAKPGAPQRLRIAPPQHYPEAAPTQRPLRPRAPPGEPPTQRCRTILHGKPSCVVDKMKLSTFCSVRRTAGCAPQRGLTGSTTRAFNTNVRLWKAGPPAATWASKSASRACRSATAAAMAICSCNCMMDGVWADPS